MTTSVPAIMAWVPVASQWEKEGQRNCGGRVRGLTKLAHGGIVKNS